MFQFVYQQGLLISLPFDLMMLSMVGTLYKGSIEYKTPMVWVVGVLFTILVGGLTGIPNALTALDYGLSDGYAIMSHFHYVMAMCGAMAVFAGSITTSRSSPGVCTTRPWASCRRVDHHGVHADYALLVAPRDVRRQKGEGQSVGLPVPGVHPHRGYPRAGQFSHSAGHAGGLESV